MSIRPTEANLRNTLCFSEENLSRLKSIMVETKIEASSHLFWEGEPADALYYVIHGCVKITKSSDEGRQFILYMYGEGDLFGQVDPYQTSTQGFNAEVSESGVVGVIQKVELEALLRQHADLAVEFMKWMGLTHRMTQTKFRDLMMFGKPGALCSLLIRMQNSFGVPHQDGIVISKRLTNTEVADMIGATRESVNRMLSDLKSAGVISTDNGRIVVKELPYLKDICHCENCPTEICRV